MTDAYAQGYEDFVLANQYDPPYGSAGEEYRRGWADANDIDMELDGR
jgi:hypothetical protein